MRFSYLIALTRLFLTSFLTEISSTSHESNLLPNSMTKITSTNNPILLDIQSYDKYQINNHNIFDNGETFYQFFTPDQQSRFKISIINFSIQNCKNDYVVGYDGLRDSNGQIKDIEMLFTTRIFECAGEIQNDHNFAKNDEKIFYSDSDRITILFRHQSINSHPSNFQILIELIETHQNLRDDQKSFTLCQREPSPIIGNLGYIKSHSSYGTTDLLSDQDLYRHCIIQLKSSNYGKIRLKFPNYSSKKYNPITIGVKMTNVNDNCELTEAHILVTDNLTNQETFLCGEKDHESIYDFDSGDITLDYYTGSWRSHGFSFEYVTLCDGIEYYGNYCQMGNRVQKSDQDSANQNGTDGHKNMRANFENSPENLEDSGENDGDNDDDDYYELIPTQENDYDTTDEPIRGSFGRNLQYTSVVGIGLLLSITIIAAAIIACHRTKEQDLLIKDLTEKLYQADMSLSRQITAISTGSQNQRRRGSEIPNIEDCQAAVPLKIPILSNEGDKMQSE